VRNARSTPSCAQAANFPAMSSGQSSSGYGMLAINITFAPKSDVYITSRLFLKRFTSSVN
jgi:hypothetical protein